MEMEKSLETLFDDTENGRDCSLEDLFIGRDTTQHSCGDDGLPLSPDTTFPHEYDVVSGVPPHS